MNSDAFEKAFEDFIDRDEYDKAQGALFTMARTSFKVGRQAVGDNPLFD